MPKKILLAQLFIIDCLYKTTAYKLDAFHRKGPRDGIYRLVVYRDGRRFILSFSEEELLEYGTSGWFDRIREKIKEALKQRWKMKTIVVAEDIANYVVYRLNNTVI